MSSTTPALTDFRRIVVKVGSSLLVDSAAGRVKEDWLASLAEDIARLHKEQARHAGGVVGRDRARPRRAQAAEGAAQARGLAGRRRGRPDRAGAHLVGGARRATASRPGRCWSPCRTPRSAAAISMRARPSSGCWNGASVPVINENDTVATNEIRYGDNDRLAARVATMASADLLVLLSDVDGLYDAPPSAGTSAKLIPLVRAHHARDRGDGRRVRLGALARRHADQDRGRQDRHPGRHPHGDRLGADRASAQGGRRTARPAPGSSRRPIRSRRARNGSRARSNPRARSTSTPARSRRCNSGNSLLPAGVIRVDGAFARGDAVVIRGPDGAEVGRGLVAYDAEDADKIKGRSSADILSILGFGGRAEMVHRDNLVVGRADVDVRGKSNCLASLCRDTVPSATARRCDFFLHRGPVSSNPLSIRRLPTCITATTLEVERSDAQVHVIRYRLTGGRRSSPGTWFMSQTTANSAEAPSFPRRWIHSK